MVASTVFAASNAAASGAVATASGVSSALIGFAGTVVGSAVVQGTAILIAYWNRHAEARKDTISRAFTTASSHMATVAFDRYVQFCEAYTEQYYAALRDLMKKGPCEDAMAHSSELAQIRQKWALWVTSDTDDLLRKFEKVLHMVGVDAMFSKHDAGDGFPERGEMIQRMYRNFSSLLGLGEWNGEELSKELALDNLMQSLRETLGTDHFAQLRQQTAQMSLQGIYGENEKT